MMLRFAILGFGAMALLAGAAQARPRHHGASAPIIAGQPNVRVTPSGNVVSRHHRVGERLRNGLVPLHHRRTGIR